MSTGGTVVEVDAEITILQNAKHEHEAVYANAEQLAADAQRAYDRARDAELYARREMDEQRKIIDEYAAEIDILLEERAALLPRPREAPEMPA